MLNAMLNFGMVFSLGAICVMMWRWAGMHRQSIAIGRGWLLLIVWSVFWAQLLPEIWPNMPDEARRSLPEGTFVPAALLGGWFVPFVLVAIRRRGNTSSVDKGRIAQ